ncbi:uncharacterized protein LOC113365318 [Ctenocephalides felis]|uniref:uncharacterized protein LOC113365318 n=1 Tax=Ctenocephalides felis TaxID=7515 RepID=UPI000E6E22C5|nr:uncharacterized protein LOC113365318 [Ctenocephalides felis]
MAKEEAALVIKGSSHINKALLSVTPGRSLLAIKGQRRSPKYKRQVTDFVNMMSNQNNTEPCSPVTTDTTGNALLEALSQAVSNTVEKFNDKILTNICHSVSAITLSDLKVRVADYLKSIYPQKNKSPPNHIKSTKRGKHPKRQNKRELRRHQYKITQLHWARNPTKCVQFILDNKVVSNKPSTDTILDQRYDRRFYAIARVGKSENPRSLAHMEAYNPK